MPLPPPLDGDKSPMAKARRRLLALRDDRERPFPKHIIPHDLVDFLRARTRAPASYAANAAAAVVRAGLGGQFTLERARAAMLAHVLSVLHFHTPQSAMSMRGVSSIKDRCHVCNTWVVSRWGISDRHGTIAQALISAYVQDMTKTGTRRPAPFDKPHFPLQKRFGFPQTPFQCINRDRVTPPVEMHPFGTVAYMFIEPRYRIHRHSDVAERCYHLCNGAFNYFVHPGVDVPRANVLLRTNGQVVLSGKTVYPYLRLSDDLAVNDAMLNEGGVSAYNPVSLDDNMFPSLPPQDPSREHAITDSVPVALHPADAPNTLRHAVSAPRPDARADVPAAPAPSDADDAPAPPAPPTPSPTAVRKAKSAFCS